MNAGGNALFADGEQFWLRAQVRSAANRPLARQKVTLYSYVGSHRLLLAQLTSDVNGRISLAVRTAAARTLEQRAVELGSIIGAPTAGKVVTGGLGVPTSNERCGLKEGACLQRFQRTGIADAWCGYFVSWVSVASGHGSAVVKSKSCDGMNHPRGRAQSETSSHESGVLRQTQMVIGKFLSKPGG